MPAECSSRARILCSGVSLDWEAAHCSRGSDCRRERGEGGSYSPRYGCVFSVGDITQYIPDKDADVAVLEEPEHLNWCVGPRHTAMQKLRIVTIGISGGRSLTGPFRDARRFPSTTMVLCTEGYAYDVGVWDLSIVQGPFSVAPCQT